MTEPSVTTSTAMRLMKGTSTQNMNREDCMNFEPEDVQLNPTVTIRFVEDQGDGQS